MNALVNVNPIELPEPAAGWPDIRGNRWEGEPGPIKLVFTGSEPLLKDNTTTPANKEPRMNALVANLSPVSKMLGAGVGGALAGNAVLLTMPPEVLASVPWWGFILANVIYTVVPALVTFIAPANVKVS